MGFRRDGRRSRTERLAWHEWRGQYAELLAASGLPPQVLRSRGDWDYLLRYGYHASPYPQIDFRLEELSLEQREAFRVLLETVLSPEEQERGCAGWHFVCPPDSSERC
ncbi:hypothetical protein GobsT_54570 [Gemmata obscuriglobus]|nr:hypothetical protein GobsT_54570 [Gemmata obscuriglobus]VTS09978.1 unnamed protein product [Gemmata obscuriglobus UQM 2246]